MAVGSNTYGTVARVEALVGDVVEGRTFSNNGTIPSKAQVEAFLDDAAAILNMELEQAAYDVPVLAANDPQAHAYLVQANSAGGAAYVLSSFPTEAYTDPDSEQMARSRRHFLERQLTNAVKLIREKRLPATRSTAVSRIYAGSQEDSKGNKKLAMFERGMTDFPGSRSLEE